MQLALEFENTHYDQIRRHYETIASEPDQDPRQLDLFRQPAPATQADPPEGRPLFRPIPLFDRAAGFRAFTAASTAACLIRSGAPPRLRRCIRVEFETVGF